MPTSALARPSALHLCAVAAEEDQDNWSPGSSNSDSDESVEEFPTELNQAPAGPNTAESRLRDRQRPSPPFALPRRTSTSPPRSSPLAASSNSALPIASGRPALNLAGGPSGLRPRPRGLSPLAPVHNPLPPSRATSLNLPKSQSLCRTLLARGGSATSQPAAAPKKTTKMIVPTKSFRTTFELGLSATELARK